MGDEEIIKRRLLIDGDGTGDDRRLNLLLKNFIKWCNTTDPQDQLFFDRLMAQWAQCTFAVHKSKFALQMIDEEIRNYEQLSIDIGKHIENAKEELKTCKLDLLTAKKIRKNHEEYDALGKVILTHPDRKQTMQELEQTRMEMENLEKESAQLDVKIERRRNHFKVLMTSLGEIASSIQRNLNDECANEEKIEEPFEDDEMDKVSPLAMDVDDVISDEEKNISFDKMELQPVSPPPLDD